MPYDVNLSNQKGAEHFSITDDSTVSLRDIYLRLCQCRDFEIKLSWERAVFMTAFLITCYAGYGGLISAYIDNESAISRDMFSAVALAISFVGMMVSFLWILMSKGSKAWYEHYECAISCFSSAYLSAPVGVLATHSWRKSLRADKLSAQGTLAVKDLRKDIINWIPISCAGGPFSVSKIVVMIGIISFIIWLLIAIIHCAMIFKQKDLVSIIKSFNESRLVWLWVYGATTIIAMIVISFWVRSKYLLELKNDKAITIANKEDKK